jgi:hypothetical protein
MARLRGTDEEKPVKEQLTFTGDDTAMANLLLSVMGAFAN